jgi:hypothetical protein
MVIPVSRTAWVVAVEGGERFEPISIDLTCDSTWSPMWQGTIVIPAADGIVEGLDPRTYTRVGVLCYTYDPYNIAAAPRRVFGRAYDVRRVVRDYAADTITLTVSSAERRMQDYAYVGGAPSTPGTVDLRARANTLAQNIGAIVTPAAGLPAFNVTHPASQWEPGQSMWENLSGMARSAGWELYDEAYWVPVNDDAVKAMGIQNVAFTLGVAGARMNANPLDPVSIVYGANMLDGSAGIDIEQGLWADSAMVIYDYQTATGARTINYYGSSAAPYHRTVVERYSQPDPGGANPATALRTRGTGRGLVLSASTYIDRSLPFNVTPGQRVNVIYPDRAVQGIAQSIKWSYPADTVEFGLIYSSTL